MSSLALVRGLVGSENAAYMGAVDDLKKPRGLGGAQGGLRLRCADPGQQDGGHVAAAAAV